MIVYECEDTFCLVKQNDHADVSGQLFDQLRKELMGEQRYQSVRKAVYEHDRAWITMDEVPIWDDSISAPYTFIDYPLPIKLEGYHRGISLTAEEDPYAGILCSLHYMDVVRMAQSHHIEEFIKQEEARLHKLKQEIDIPEVTQLKHLNVLQFLDRLSLFICYQEGEINNYPFQSNGAINIEKFSPEAEAGEARIKWLNEGEMAITPFLFKEDFSIELKLKYVKKDLIDQLGIYRAYKNTNWSKRVVKIVKDDSKQSG